MYMRVIDLDMRKRIPDSPPVIKPLPTGVVRPLWSVMIPVYNCASFLKNTLESVLAQDPGNHLMQIEVVDDGSTDADIARLVRDLAGDRISYFRQPENVGSLRNFQTCIDRAQGRLIHLLHGDDIVRAGFYKKFERMFDRYPAMGAAFCRYAYIDQGGKVMYHQDAEMDGEGILRDWLVRLGERQRIQYVAMVVKREVYEQLGSFYGVEYGEDWEMWVRVAARYPVGYTPDVLADYRKHDSSISGKSFLTGKNMQALELVMNRIQQYVPAEHQPEVLRKSKKFYAHYAMRVANALWSMKRHRAGAVAQANAAWNMSKDVSLLYKIFKLYTRIIFHL
jgi:glycosyltransferase involved in cell wall biosynthesis